MHQDDVQVVGIQVGVIRQDATGKVIQSPSHLDTCKPATGHNKRQYLPASGLLSRAVGALESIDDMVSDPYGVQEGLKIKGQFLKVLQTQVVRYGS